MLELSGALNFVNLVDAHSPGKNLTSSQALPPNNRFIPMQCRFKKIVYTPFFLSTAFYGIVSFSNLSLASEASCLRNVLAAIVSPPSTHLPWNQKIVFRETEKLLERGRIVGVRALGEAQAALGKVEGGTHSVFILDYEEGTRAVWKPNSNNSVDAECDAYQFARLIKSRQVPPTVKRVLDENSVDLTHVKPEIWAEVKGKIGSAQYYVDSPYDLKAKTPEERLKVSEAVKRITPKDLSDKKAFYFVAGQWDAHDGNMILDATSSIALIDNSEIRALLKVRYGELPFRRGFALKKSAEPFGVSEPSQFPFEQAVLLKNPSKEQFSEFLKGSADPKSIDSYWIWRAKSKDNTMNVLVWKDRVWVQGIGFQNYGPMAPEVFSQSTLDAYRSLTYSSLRSKLSPFMTDEHIHEILDRRDQLLHAAVFAPKIP